MAFDTEVVTISDSVLPMASKIQDYGVATDVAAVGDSVLQIASKIEEYGNGFYRASADWEDFPRKVALLREALLRLEQSKPLWNDATVIETLSRAKSVLAGEQARLVKRKLTRRNPTSTLKWFTKLSVSPVNTKLSMTLFPRKVSWSIQTVVNTFDAIPGFLKWAKTYETQPRSIPRQDDRYVRMEVSESEVHTALNNPMGPNVVLLHGGPGSGKSCLARYVAIQHDEEGRFDHVVYMECGPQVNTLSKEKELLAFLGHSIRGQAHSDSLIPTLLLGVLESRNILIIFDDVWEREFLQQMVDLCGAGVKCLVTSQVGRLCEGLNFSTTAIKIQDLRIEDSRKILASHVGFSRHHIPLHLQEVTAKIVDLADGNPLTLAAIATAIHYNRRDELLEWEIVAEDIYRSLYSEDTPYGYGAKFSRNYYSAVRESIQSLSEDARNLLLLIHLCDEHVIPEEVVHILYYNLSGNLQGDFATFAKLRQELELHGLLRITYESIDKNEHSQKYRSWSIPLLKIFIETEMQDQSEVILRSIVERFDKIDYASVVEPANIAELPSEDGTMVILCALYLQSYFAEKIGSKEDILTVWEAKLFSYGHPFDKVEHMSRMLESIVREQCTATQRSAARLELTYFLRTGLLRSGSNSDTSEIESPIENLYQRSFIGKIFERGWTIENSCDQLPVRCDSTDSTSSWISDIEMEHTYPLWK